MHLGFGYGGEFRYADAQERRGGDGVCQRQDTDGWLRVFNPVYPQPAGWHSLARRTGITHFTQLNTRSGGRFNHTCSTFGSPNRGRASSSIRLESW